MWSPGVYINDPMWSVDADPRPRALRENKDCVDVIGHDDVLVQQYPWIFMRNLLPPPLDHPARSVQIHLSVADTPKQQLALLNHKRDEVPSR